MILRDARRDDEAALIDFDLGEPNTVWLDEVSEIVAGLIAWRADKERADLDRRVIVAEVNGEIVAVAVHECSEDQQGRSLAEGRYLMVVAVRHDQRRGGIAKVLAESVIAEMQRYGVRSVHWLVHPTNLASIGFSRVVFPEDRRNVSTRRQAIRQLRPPALIDIRVQIRGCSGAPCPSLVGPRLAPGGRGPRIRAALGCFTRGEGRDVVRAALLVGRCPRSSCPAWVSVAAPRSGCLVRRPGVSDELFQHVLVDLVEPLDVDAALPC